MVERKKRQNQLTLYLLNKINIKRKEKSKYLIDKHKLSVYLLSNTFIRCLIHMTRLSECVHEGEGTKVKRNKNKNKKE